MASPRAASALRRVLDAVPVLLGAALLTFALMHLTPGDPVRVMLGERANAEQMARLKHELGLDRPLPEQFVRYLGRALTGDLGRSLRTKDPVTEDLGRAFGATAELALAAMTLAVPLGILLGSLAAYRAGSWIDLAVSGLSVGGLSMPVFWLGVVLMQVLGAWLPFDGRLSLMLEFPQGPITGLYGVDALLYGRLDILIDVVSRIALPALTLCTIPLALTARITRATMMEELHKDYVRTARAKGAGERVVVMVHAFRNASVVVLTAVGLQLGYLLGGAVLTERIFNWPGVGTYAVEAVLARDFPAMQGSVLFLASLFLLVNLVVDLLYGVLDPRIEGAAS